MTTNLSNTSFGDYLIYERIGRGGMAAVYRALDQRSGQEVALKILHQHLLDEGRMIQRFLREAEIIRALDHPNIVKILDSGIVENQPFFALVYMKNGSTEAFFRQPTRLSARAALRMLSQVAAGLDYAHQRGVVHRDVKLENILLGEKGHIALTDFGIARVLDVTRLSATGMMAGTPLYMSPEQVRGAADLDHRTDLYALGVIGYLLATGYFPFAPQDVMSAAYQTLNLLPPPPSAVKNDLPKALDAVLARALAKNPDDRYQSASAFVRAYSDALYSQMEAETVIMTQVDNPISPQGMTVLAKPKKRGRGVALLLLLLVALLGAAAALWLRPEQLPAIIAAPSATQTHSPTASATQTHSPTATDSATPSRTPPPPSATFTFTPAPIPPTMPPAPMQEIAFQSNRQGFWELYLLDLLTNTERKLSTSPTSMINPIWSPDGLRLAFVSERDGNMEIYTMNVDGSDAHNLTQHPAQDFNPSWSPDGVRLAFVTDRDGDMEIYVLDTANGTLQNLSQSPFDDLMPSWSPDGAKLAFATDREGVFEIFVMDASGGNQFNRSQSATGDDLMPAWSPDGRWIAFVSNRDGNFEIYRMNADGSGQINLSQSPAADLMPAWSPDGTRLVFVSERDGDNELFSMGNDGQNLVQHTFNSADDRAPAWRP